MPLAITLFAYACLTVIFAFAGYGMIEVGTKLHREWRLRRLKTWKVR